MKNEKRSQQISFSRGDQNSILFISEILRRIAEIRECKKFFLAGGWAYFLSETLLAGMNFCRASANVFSVFGSACFWKQKLQQRRKNEHSSQQKSHGRHWRFSHSRKCGFRIFSQPL